MSRRYTPGHRRSTYSCAFRKPEKLVIFHHPETVFNLSTSPLPGLPPITPRFKHFNLQKLLYRSLGLFDLPTLCTPIYFIKLNFFLSQNFQRNFQEKLNYRNDFMGHTERNYPVRNYEKIMGWVLQKLMNIYY